MKMQKNLWAVLLIAVMALALTACSSTVDQESLSEAPAETPAAEEDTTYTVGIIQLVPHVALDAATKGFRDALSEKLGDKVIFDEQNASNDVQNCSVIANQFVSAQVDLIMANATPALQAAQAATDTIPILGTSVTDYATALGLDNWTGATGSNISGTSDLAPLDGQAAIIQELFPETEKVGILYCSGEPNSKYQDGVITGYLTEMGYTCQSYTFSDSNDLQTVVASAAADSDVLYVPTDNTAASNTEIIKNICLPAQVPVVVGEEGICRGCGLATLSISYYDLGYTTGLMAYEILANGADPGGMAVEFAPNVTKKYNAEIAAALGIVMPEGYEAISAE